MPELKNMRFSKDGDYGNKIFICNKTKEPETFAILSELYNKLKSNFPEQFLPVFCNNKHNYATIRFKLDKKFEKNDIYTLDFIIKKKVDNDKTYINCFLNKAKKTGEATKSDDGESLDF